MRLVPALTALFAAAVGCASPAEQPEYFRDRYPRWDLKTTVAYHVDDDVALSRDVIADGAAMLDQFGYPLVEVADDADARLHIHQMPADRSCTNDRDWLAYEYWCGEIFLCPEYAASLSATTIAHEIAHALGVWHVPRECKGDEAETPYGPACGRAVMNPSLSPTLRDFTVVDAAAFHLRASRGESIFSPMCVAEYRKTSGNDPYY